MKILSPVVSIFILWVGLFNQLSAQQCPTLPSCKFVYTIGSDGFTVTFDGEVSCDPGLVIKWDFGDGDITTGNGMEDPKHIYSEDGTYVVRMTVHLPAPHTGCAHTQTKTIVIAAGAPAFMQLDLTGPTIATECQQVTYTANVVGGVPPYTYEWEFDNYYCTSCSGTACNPSGNNTTILIGGPSKTVQFDYTGLGTSNFTVTVTDGQGSTKSENWSVKVKDAFARIEIKTTAEQASCGTYGTNSDILFWPDIDPLFTFDYPTDYVWNFGDGTVHEDRYDGGGLYLKQYEDPGSYTVTLNVCDPNGCMQTTRQVDVCNPNAGGGSENACTLEIVGQPGDPTVIMDYDVNTSLPSDANVQIINTVSCPFSSTYAWTATLSPDLGLANPVLFSQVNSLCGLSFSEIMGVQLYSSGCWNQLLSAVPGLEAHRPWGCVGLACVKNCTGSTGNSTDVNDCIVYIQPDALEVKDFAVEGSCTEYTVSAVIQGGGWKKVGNNFTYKQILWQAYDTHDHEKELTGIFIDIPGVPGKKKINLNHPYFQQFGPRQFVEFMVKMKVQDYANGSVETNQLVAFDPFRLHLEDSYKRCPGIQSQFSREALVTGKSNEPYTFAWTPTILTGANPTFTAPAADITDLYTLTVTAGPGCSLSKQVSVTGEALTLDLYDLIPACAALNCGRPINPTDAGPSGGSGHYKFSWSPTTYLSAADIYNPTVQGIPAGQAAIYVLTVEDEYGGCTASDTKQVDSYANNLTLELSGPSAICYGTGAVLQAKGLPIIAIGTTYQYSWSTDNPYHVGIENVHARDLPINTLESSYPGTYNYKVRYTNLSNGCYKEKEIATIVKPSWKHTGYVPNVKSAVAGTSVDLWSGGYTNGITGGVTNLNNISVSWLPANPTSTAGYGGTDLPSNGKFTPTAAVPYLTMKVIDNATGCSQTFKSQRYIVSDERPDLWVTADKNPVVCAGGTVCFEVYLDAHVAYPTSLLPHSVDVTYSLQDVSNIIVKSGLLKLTLESFSGIYHGRVCYTFTQNPPNEFQFWVQPTNYFWDADVPGAYKIYLAPASTVQSYVGCVLNDVGSPKKDIKLGINCGSLGIVQNTGAIKVRAKDFIEIYPDGQMEIGTNSDQTIGAHFFINPCLLTSFQNDSLPPDIVEERTMADSATILVRPDVTLQVFPNPFTSDVTIRYTLPADCSGDAMLYLRDFMGRQIKTLERRVNAAPGAYQVVFDGSSLPPGIYLYELVVCNGAQVVKKAEKIGH